MRKHYPLFALLSLSATNADAQAYGELNINDVRARFYANGRVSMDTLTGQSNFEVPQGGAASALYSGGLWIGGQTSGGQLRLSKTVYDWGNEAHLYPGPLTVTDATTTQTISDLYNHVWSVTKAEIATHLAYFQCQQDPNCDLAVEFPGGYTIPSSILEWPAMGDVSAGYHPFLAPFYDYDATGNYDPLAGDAPCILGDQALFFVFNDHLGLQNGNLPLGLEVQAMPFAYTTGSAALDQTVFVRYHLINRSTQTYQNTMIGFFNDFDLGCADDDFIGSDPSRNLAYVYNWDDNDQDCNGAAGYGDQPPAFGMMLIKGPLADPNNEDDAVSNELPNWNGCGFGDAIVDNERFGLAHFMYFNRNSTTECCNDPYTTSDSYSYLRGVWKDGVTMTYGGNGHSLDPNAVSCAFMYPGADDPVGSGTGGIAQAPWSETVPTPAEPDRRGLMSMGEITLEPGEHVDLLFAYVYARASSGGAVASVAALQARVDSVRAFAATLPIWNVPEAHGFSGQCTDYPFLGIGEEPELSTLDLFPTPTSDVVRFTAPRELIGGRLTLRDATGRVALEQRILPGMNTINVERLANGVYHCDALTRNTRFTGRLVKH